MADLGLIQCLQSTRCPGCRKGEGAGAAAPPGAKASLALAPDPKSALFNPLPSVTPRGRGLGRAQHPAPRALHPSCCPAPAREQRRDEPGEKGEWSCLFFSFPPPLCFSHTGFKILLVEIHSRV